MAASAAAAKRYDGPDRRHNGGDRRHGSGCGSCFEHSGILQRIASVEDKTSDLESQGFLSHQSYWWTTGILVSIFVAILSASVYATFSASEALREVKASQTALSIQIGYIQKDIEQLKVNSK